ncbi:TIGR03620 family F420-dependent LLM class oxidoreductase (plasmid) [Rhodococcus sp. USK10]|uniref:TIGR03620 family F420-dependent LLM class oxidoreductase n=1 Tax=Rhodococcus sp. USK10 TaxID=2789739 RepID=UPI001C5E6807|nr:TIGR03620 family F420-dependent LLM class oxidoreductase [Rhodococcus sp. USK10]QYB00220.1 TIGR03620 family F420-dependent LLM class oxidoreductase [Rhodococcus sp. USK10]
MSLPNSAPSPTEDRWAAWLTLVGHSAASLRTTATGVEALGFRTLWFPETPNSREAFTQAALLLGATERLRIATGVANVWARDATVAAAVRRTLEDAYPGRFIMGLGTSHAVRNADRGHTYTKPLTFMREYLHAMSAAGPFDAGSGQSPVMIAALRGRMQELAREAADGMHTFFAPPEHTARARRILGPDPRLVPQQAFIITDDRDSAVERARAYVSSRLALPNYANHLIELGFTERELADGGSSTLVERMVAIGDADEVVTRLSEHHQAGADQVAAHPLDERGGGLPQLRLLTDAIARTYQEPT